MKLPEHLVVELIEYGMEPVKARALGKKLYPDDVADQTAYSNIVTELTELDNDIEDLRKMRVALSCVRNSWAMVASTNGNAPPEASHAADEILF